MKTRYFILIDHQVVRVLNHKAWASWYHRTSLGERLVDATDIGDTHVSTAFIGLDDYLFQTMVFGGPLDSEVLRTTTFKEARCAHARMVSRVRLSDSV